jgi:hypothetical protein
MSSPPTPGLPTPQDVPKPGVARESLLRSCQVKPGAIGVNAARAQLLMDYSIAEFSMDA